MNKVCLIGRITKDIELRYTQNSIAVAQFNLAVNRKYKNQNGDYDTDFINCVAYKKTAELMKEYLQKGDLIGIDGRVQTRTYEDDKQKKHYITEIIVDSMDFLQSKPNTQKEEKESSNVAETKSSGISDDIFSDFGSSIEINDEDIAF